eukprot:4244034-Alexandrium_andersonii.AAC.1
MSAQLRAVVGAVGGDPAFSRRQSSTHVLELLNGPLGGSNMLSNAKMRRAQLTDPSGDEKVIGEHARNGKNPALP